MYHPEGVYLAIMSALTVRYPPYYTATYQTSKQMQLNVDIISLLRRKRLQNDTRDIKCGRLAKQTITV